VSKSPYYPGGNVLLARSVHQELEKGASKPNQSPPTIMRSYALIGAEIRIWLWRWRLACERLLLLVSALGLGERRDCL